MTAQQQTDNITWLKVMELGYEEPPKPPHVICFCCGRRSDKLLHCAQCLVAQYDQKECQVQDWKASHKRACDSYKRIGRQMKFSSPIDHANARLELYQRIRVYGSAYAVHKSDVLGKGFLFVQSTQTLAALSLKVPKDCYGHPLVRSLLLHFLTLGEFDQEVCRDDFELTQVRSELQDAVEHYDRETELILLMRFRCGHVAIGRTTLALEYCACRQVGREYFGGNNTSEALQLNIDDV